MLTKFIAQLTTVIAVSVKGEQRAAGVIVVAQHIAHYVAVYVGENVLVELECDIGNITFAEDNGECADVNIIEVLIIVETFGVIDRIAVFSVFLDRIECAVSKFDQSAEIVAVLSILAPISSLALFIMSLFIRSANCSTAS